MLANDLNELYKKLLQEAYTGNRVDENELIETYDRILANISADYSTYRLNIPILLNAIEQCNTVAIAYELEAFFRKLNNLVYTDSFLELDTSIIDLEADKSLVDRFTRISQSANKEIRISDFSLNLTSFTSDEIKALSSTVIELIQEAAKSVNWNEEKIVEINFSVICLRQLLINCRSVELFYYIIGIYLDRMATSGYYQLGRNLCEEIIIASYKDNLPELGFLNSFRFYSNTSNPHGALTFGNIALELISRKKPPYVDRFVRDFIFQAMKLFRNIGLHGLVKKIYHNIPPSLTFASYERRHLAHMYFSSLIAQKDKELLSKIFDYTNRYREDIINGGVHDSLPWLILLYNVRRLYTETDFNEIGLGNFVDILEMVVPKKEVQRIKDIIEGSPSLRQHLLDSIAKLKGTNSHSDFVYDNDEAIKISHRLLESSVGRKCPEDFMLSMVLLSDYSLMFESKSSEDLIPFNIPDANSDDLNKAYRDLRSINSLMKLSPSDTLLMLAIVEDKLYQMVLKEQQIHINESKEWNYYVFRQLIAGQYFSALSFDDIKRKEGYPPREKYPEEYARESLQISKDISIGKIDFISDSNCFFIIKDIDLADYPHNLLLNTNGEFIAQRTPITNILSTEWYKSQHDKRISQNYSKSIWIPTESGDYVINLLNSGIDETLKENDFNVTTSAELHQPLSSSLNIICSHGSQNISQLPFIRQTNSPMRLNKFVGKGQILIFFVCFSGSMTSEMFRNSYAALARDYISSGYDAVIAPFWALDATLPKFWLPAFLDSLRYGNRLDKAVFDANQKVFEKFPHPAAWACLHLYGNPLLRIAL